MREQTIGFNMVIVMTLYNVLIGILMLTVLPVWAGMLVSFGGMGIIIYASIRLLMGDDRPWRHPRSTSNGSRQTD